MEVIKEKIVTKETKAKIFDAAAELFARDGFYKISGLFKKEQNIDFDVVLNLSHGGDGEDGILSSVLNSKVLTSIASPTLIV